MTGLLAHDLDFTGKRVLITGAANGFGAAMAAGFASHGASLVLADIETDTLAARVKEIGGAIEAHHYDQADGRSIAALAEAASTVDVLVNNAGVLSVQPILEASEAEIRRLFEVDFFGLVLLTQKIAPGMIARRRGVVINISSQLAFAGAGGRAFYAAAKAAVAQFTRSAAVEWASEGVRVVGIAPGRSATRMTAQIRRPGETDPGLAHIPMGRYGTAEEVAKLALFLASDAASYITGEVVIADGGYVLG